MDSPMRSSIVRVDSVEESRGSDYDIASRLTSYQDEPFRKSSKAFVEDDSQKGTEDQEDIDDEGNDEEEEAKDKVLALPENWPRIPQIFERRNWEFSTNASPIVNKAASHLELLQTIIEEWFKAEGSCAVSRASNSRGSILKSAALGGKDKDKKDKQLLRFAAAGSSFAGSSRSATALSIEGVGTFSDAHSSISNAPPPRVEVTYELPYLGAEEVIEEVITLLAKLENDRQETLVALSNERDRSETLRSKIDELCRKRMIELPVLVQREHEACARDIAELQWHVDISKREEERVQQRLKNAQAMQGKLEEELKAIKEHVPLMLEKLNLEIEAMQRIQNAQKDTEEELEMTLKRYNYVKEKYEEAQRKAEEERLGIKRDLTKVQDDLSGITEELSVSKMTYNTYVHHTLDYRQQIEDYKREKVELEDKFERSKAANDLIQARVTEVETHLKEAEVELKKLQKDVEDLNIEMEWKDQEYQKQASTLAETREKIEDEIREFVRRNDALKMDISDKEAAIRECDFQKKKDDKDMERMEKHVIQLESRYKEAMLDLVELRRQHASAKRQMDDEEAACRREEEKLKASADTLKRQVMEELHTKATLAARMENDGKELVEFTQKSDEHKLKVTKMASEIEEQKNVVLTRVESLRKKFGEVRRELEEVQEKKQLLDQTSAQFYEQVKVKKAELEPTAKIVLEQVKHVREELDVIVDRTEAMNKEIEEKQDLSKRLEKRITKKQVDLKNLEMDNRELKTQLDEQTDYKKWVEEELKLLQERLKILKKTHSEYVNQRTNFMEKMKEDKEKEKILNTDLATRYRQLQNAHYLVKKMLLDVKDKNLQKQVSITDAKKLRMLQQHMHHSMVDAMSARRAFSEVELKGMNSAVKSSAVRLGHLQSDMDVGLNQIQDFLENQLDGDAIKKIATERVDKLERGEELSDIASVVTDSRPVTRASVPVH